jgi:hypothetical protein
MLTSGVFRYEVAQPAFLAATTARKVMPASAVVSV